MKRYGWILCVLFFIPSSVHAAVSISEIAWMGTSKSSYCEWLEFYNDSASDVSLQNWQLFKDSGTTLIFNFSKTIAANGYLLLERTTATCPDPVPGVNDESGTFGGGGLSNEGENLVLKDATGTIVQSLNDASGWPAGDASSRDTMQWNGSSWVTDVATPKAPYSGTSATPSDDSSSTTVLSSPSSSSVIPTFIPNIALAVPDQIYTGVDNTYSAQVTLEHAKTTAGYYVWNFGDGAVIRSIGITPVTHRYQYPGSYVITLTYHPITQDSVTVSELHVQKILSVSAASLLLSSIGNGWFQIKNVLAQPVDISDWIVHAGSQSRTFPEYSIIAPSATIHFSLATLGISDMTNQVTLSTATGMQVASVMSPIRQKKINTLSSTPQIISPSAEVILKETDTSQTNQKVPQAPKHRTKIWIYGAVLVATFGLFVLLERFFMA